LGAGQYRAHFRHGLARQEIALGSAHDQHASFDLLRWWRAELLQLREISPSFFLSALRGRVEQPPPALVLRQRRHFEIGVIGNCHQGSACPAVSGDDDRTGLRKLGDHPVQLSFHLRDGFDFHRSSLLLFISGWSRTFDSRRTTKAPRQRRKSILTWCLCALVVEVFFFLWISRAPPSFHASAMLHSLSLQGITCLVCAKPDALKAAH